MHNNNASNCWRSRWYIKRISRMVIDKPNGKRSDYLCEITSEIIDEVINTLPKSIRSGETLLKEISPACTKIK